MSFNSNASQVVNDIEKLGATVKGQQHMVRIYLGNNPEQSAALHSALQHSTNQLAQQVMQVINWEYYDSLNQKQAA